jgi:hypothetical protein
MGGRYPQCSLSSLVTNASHDSEATSRQNSSVLPCHPRGTRLRARSRCWIAALFIFIFVPPPGERLSRRILNLIFTLHCITQTRTVKYIKVMEH